ncbi:MAG: Elongation factor Ts [Candidatus Magasanikbacteria bacterium GW2011_GWC2_40_17]|uniref:Elongation factor Ts n=1 Tax=Candidatus Magasanikbacteria bacterium GW2011_GWA2_42_32 TaxID=1619039 RepID=A0A0G1D3S6_9BACT|nr:MAG: Elongation factor Ts [Candidatus Magasanikbacteria bacterium GW2011_GWC2_40_17]KKS56633.1 MAG: Elongation factor Ts [Candidatus Magasanikbacteria bacterium GW2011_GWA2_42_32]OGH86101.1 MAG: translation elongation factor Ts [Candidatus Magasanikbacteria bacterium RIFOXYB2_FULL_38_10]
MAIDIKLITEIREVTGAGMVDVKNALEEAGSKDAAIELLRKKGIIKAAKKGDRQTKEGLVHAYVHSNNKAGALVEVWCETDFVARNAAFQELVHNIAMHIVAANPFYISNEEIPAEEVEKEKNIQREILKAEGKPEAMIEKILEGKMQKYFADICLLNQPYIKDDKITVGDLVKQNIAVIGENIEVKRFVRFAM